MNIKTAQTLLEEGIPPHWLKVERKLIKPLLPKYRLWWHQNAPTLPVYLKEIKWRKMRKRVSELERQSMAYYLVKFLCYCLNQELTRMAIRREQFDGFNKRYSRAVTVREQRQLILDFAQQLGANWWQLRGDRKAFSRWFGQDAMTDRYQRLQGMSERRLSFFLKRLGFLAQMVLKEDAKTVEMWQAIDLEKSIEPLLYYNGDSRIRIEAFRCLAFFLKRLPEDSQENNVKPDTLQYIYRLCVDYEEEVWLQSEAIQLLETFSRHTLPEVLQKRFNAPGEGDDFFVRRRAVEILSHNIPDLPELLQLIPQIATDSSPFVRQALAKALEKAPVEIVKTHLTQLAQQDTVTAVRGGALLEILSLLPQRPELNGFLLELLSDSLTKESDSFVLRVALKVATEACQILSESEDWLIDSTADSTLQHWQNRLLKTIEQLHRSEEKPIAIRRFAAQAAERLWCQMTPQARTLRTHLQKKLRTMKPAQRRYFAKRPLKSDDMTFARVLSVLSQEDFGYDVLQNWFNKTLIRGHLFGFRVWRWLHEMKHPDPSKRQGYRHTIGRYFPGQLRIPSGILCELAETKVPGEPLFMATEGGWRPYLPLVDELIDCLMRNQVVQIYTSEGITTLKPPKYLLRQLWARWKLTWQFTHYAHLRNWHEDSQSPASSYIEALQSLGFQIHYQPHTYPNLPEFKADPAVERFFPITLPIMPIDGIEEFFDRDTLQGVWLRIQDYFFSVYQNTLQDLWIFAGAALGYFFFKHLHANLLLNQTRANIPLIVGGWGTRGKSGTERIKAGMFNALGYSIFSKTTGCEAMFLHASSFKPTLEMFLFRPYDKATIWEQYNVLRQADKMGMDIFLWECMGLTPAYVEILQKQWTRDDISTITNTYPDHEDLQGPAGINIPIVMTNFIPRNGILVTTEEQMLPILQTAADEFKTRLRPVTWLEAGLLTPDVLKRFPYEEHPYNIALVLAVGDELDIPADFALKEMADRVVLDLGVLKTYPVSSIKTRKLEFVMGMSANERFGALGNWSRMGFRDQDFENEPGIWLSTVVNNRSDRIARSRVFASLLVEDVSADQHVIIGTNLTGMVGYIRETWDNYAPKLTLWPETNAQHAPLLELEAAARKARIPVTASQMQTRLRIMLSAQGELENLEDLLSLWQQPKKLFEHLPETVEAENAQAILARHELDLKHYEGYQALAAKLENVTSAQQEELDNAFRQLLWQWFESKLVVIHNAQTTGDQIVNQIASGTPPGFLNRIMGMQNIKGTGLDFVYRWQAWESCYQAGEKLKSKQVRTAEEGLNALVAFKEYGPLTEEYVRETIVQVQQTPTGQLANFQTGFTLILSHLEQAMNEIKSQGGENLTESNKKVFFKKVLEFIEQVLDAGDAVKRRKIADQVYKDMVTGRISNQTAALQVKKLNKRQKGGWLTG
jgi:gamma-polyglutamate synthase